MQETLQSGASWKASRSRSSLAHESRWTHPGGLTAHAMPLCTFFFSLMPLSFSSSLKTSINDLKEDGLAKGEKCLLLGCRRPWTSGSCSTTNTGRATYLSELKLHKIYMVSPQIVNPSIFTVMRVSTFPQWCSAFLHLTVTAAYTCGIDKFSHQWGLSRRQCCHRQAGFGCLFLEQAEGCWAVFKCSLLRV